MKAMQSLTLKIFAIMAFSTIIFYSVSTFAWDKSLTRQATNTAKEHMVSVISVLEETFDENIREIDYSAAFLSNRVKSAQNDCIITFLTTASDQTQKISESQRQTHLYMLNRCNFKPYLNGMAVYGADGRSCTYGVTTPYEEAAQEEWFRNIISGREEVVYLSPRPYTKKKPSPETSYVFSIVRPVMDGPEIVGVIKADIKESLLKKIFDINAMQGYSLYILDSRNGTEVYAPEESAETDLSATYPLMQNSSGVILKDIDGNSNMFVYSASTMVPWTIVGVISQKMILRDFYHTKNQLLIVMILSGISCSVLSFLVLRFATKDLRTLTRAVESIHEDNLEISEIIKSRDEVKILYDQINSMLARIRNLIQRIRDAESETRKSEMQMLAMQISPHFLYNTLHTIKILAMMQGIRNIQQVCDSLSRMIHLNLDSRKMISMEEEKQYLKDYLNIQEYRYAGKITYDISFSDDLEGLLIPKLLVQPVVENALQHGASKSTGTGFVQITAFSETGKIHIIIKNNGPEFPKELLSGVHYRENSSQRIGLNNISRRLKLLFGDDADFKIISGKDMLTSAEIIIPAIAAEGEDDNDENSYS